MLFCFSVTAIYLLRICSHIFCILLVFNNKWAVPCSPHTAIEGVPRQQAPVGVLSQGEREEGMLVGEALQAVGARGAELEDILAALDTCGFPADSLQVMLHTQSSTSTTSSGPS